MSRTDFSPYMLLDIIFFVSPVANSDVSDLLGTYY
jgi:hypothetical protein